MNRIREIAGALAIELKARKTRRIFVVPGENPYLLPALHKEGIESIVCHHEAYGVIAASYSAVPWKYPGFAYASIGPGTTNAVTGLATCFLDEVPVVCVVETEILDDKAEKHQCLNQLRLLSPVVKSYFLLSQLQEVDKTLEAAVSKALDPPFGPVVIGIPVRRALPRGTFLPDLISEKTQPDFKAPTLAEFSNSSTNSPVQNSKNPSLVIIGSRPPHVDEVNKAPLKDALAECVLLTTLMGKRAINENALKCSGWLDRDGTVYLYDGGSASLSSIAGNFENIVAFNINPAEGISPLILRQAAPKSAISFNCQTVDNIGDEFVINGWDVQSGDSNALFEETLSLIQHGKNSPLNVPGSEHSQRDASLLVSAHHQHLVSGGAVTIDVGSFKRHLATQIKSTGDHQVFISNGLSTLGSMLAAAIGLGFSNRFKRVVCYMGDGGFMMALSEMATIAQYELPIAILVIANDGYRQMRDKQILKTGIASGTDFQNPNFAHLAKGFGFNFFKVNKKKIG